MDSKTLARILIAPCRLLSWILEERQIGTILGVPILVGTSLTACLIVWAAMGLWWMLPFAIMLWSIVTLHEIGHCWAAKAVGWECNRITLIIFGGMAEIDLNVFEPKKEFLVSVAGPMVNVILAVAALPLLWVDMPYIATVFLMLWMQINIGLGLFNLLPIFPMDGGRILRSFATVWSGDMLWSARLTKYAGRFCTIPTLYVCWINGWFMAVFIIPFMLYIAAREEIRVMSITKQHLKIPADREIIKISVDEENGTMTVRAKKPT